MPTLNFKTFDQMVTDQVAAQQAQSGQMIDMSTGSVMRAINESIAYVAQWLQSLIAQMIPAIRLSTSAGADVDSFIADFGCSPRLPAVASSGLVVFSRASPTSRAEIYPGATVQSVDGNTIYEVLPDISHGLWSSAISAYVLAPGVASVTVRVTAKTTGAAGNAAIGAVSVISTGIPMIDTVTNISAFTIGQDAETDDAVKLRFMKYITSLSQGTISAVMYAATSLQAGMQCKVIENYSYAGAVQPGNFLVIIDDGSGYPSAGLITTATAAIEAIRPLSATFAVYAPAVVPVDVNMTIVLMAGHLLSEVSALITGAVATYLNSLPLGEPVPYTMIATVAYEASPIVANVTNITLNGGIADIVITNKQVIKARNISLS